MARRTSLAVLLLAAASCGTARIGDEGLLRLTGWMTGSFASTEQAKADPDFLDIRLRMVRIWPDRADAVWLYVEQAVAGAEERPYRQRVYRLTRVAADLFESRVYELPDPRACVGAWRDPAPLAALAPDALVPREGCEILLRDRDDHFAGSTLGRLCESDLRGATWASSEAAVTATTLLSWDRGFDDAGGQVWGSAKGAYRFLKVEDYGD